MRPPAPLKARWILPRCFVCASRISQLFFLERIKSNQGFFTTSNIFVERRRALLLPAFLCPVVVLPPYTSRFKFAILFLRPVVVLPPYVFRFKFADDAFFLKHTIQNFARGEAALFLQRGMLHFFVMFASPGKLRRGRYLSPHDYGINFDMNYRIIKQTSASTMLESARILLRFCQDSVKILLSFCWGPSRIPLRALESTSPASCSFCQDSAGILQMPTQSVVQSADIFQDSIKLLLGIW